MKTKDVVTCMWSCDNSSIMQLAVNWCAANMCATTIPYLSVEDVHYIINQPIETHPGTSGQLSEDYAWKEFFSHLIFMIENPEKATKAVDCFNMVKVSSPPPLLVMEGRLLALLKLAAADIINQYEILTRTSKSNLLFELIEQRLYTLLVKHANKHRQADTVSHWDNSDWNCRLQDFEESTFCYLELLVNLAEVIPQFLDDKHAMAFWKLSQRLITYQNWRISEKEDLLRKRKKLYDYGLKLVRLTASSPYSHLSVLKDMVYFCNSFPEFTESIIEAVNPNMNGIKKEKFIDFLQKNAETSVANPEEKELSSICAGLLKKFN